MLGAGVVAGMVRHLGKADREHLTVETISAEAVTTSEIEGEILIAPVCSPPSANNLGSVRTVAVLVRERRESPR